MSEHYQEEEEATTIEPDAKKFSLVGGAVGTVLGARRGRAAAVLGGLVGGTVGYLTGTVLGRSAEPPEPANEPVVVTVDGDEEEEEETDATAERADAAEEDNDE